MRFINKRANKLKYRGKIRNTDTYNPTKKVQKNDKN